MLGGEAVDVGRAESGVRDLGKQWLSRSRPSSEHKSCRCLCPRPSRLDSSRTRGIPTGLLTFRKLNESKHVLWSGCLRLYPGRIDAVGLPPLACQACRLASVALNLTLHTCQTVQSRLVSLLPRTVRVPGSDVMASSLLGYMLI